MESWQIRKRLAANHVAKKYGKVQTTPFAEFQTTPAVQARDIAPPRQPEDITGLLIHESDIDEELGPDGTFFSKYSVSDIQELLVFSQTHWLLTGKEFDSKFNVELSSGLIRNLEKTRNHPDRIVIVWEADESIPPLELIAVHQIVRELIVGIYVMNQTPFINMISNYDKSAVCHIPPAYQDSYIGQLMIAVDFLMKGMWHGIYMPLERRLTFNDQWKTRLRVKEDGKAHCKLPVLYEFQSAGLYDITKEEDLQDIYDSVPKKLLKPVKQSNDFLNEMEDVIVTLTFFQQTIQHTNGVYYLDSDYFAVGSRCTAANEVSSYDHLTQYLHSLGDVIMKNLSKKSDMKQKLLLLKILSLLIPVFISMKRLFKIPRLVPLMPPFRRQDIQTERSLPPITVGQNFKNAAFFQEGQFTHLHGGIQFDIETPEPIPFPPHLIEAVNANLKLDPENTDYEIEKKFLVEKRDEKSTVPIITIKGKKYYILKLWLETFAPQKNPRPKWLKPLYSQMAQAKFMSLPLIECQILEVFQTFHGKKAKDNYENLEWAFHEASRLGLVSVIHALLRLMPKTRLEKQNEKGLSVTHVAAMHNHSHILGQLAYVGLNMDTRKGMYSEPKGLTPLHLAARVGALRSLSFLLAIGADVTVRDQNGYAAIHHAACNNQLQVVRLLVMKFNQLELETDNKLKLTPLLLAAQRGALDTMICLLNMGAQRNCTDSKGRNCIVLAALEYRHHILDYFIQQQYQDMVAWTTLVDMLKSEELTWRYGSCKTIEILSSNPCHLQPILQSGIPPLLVEVLQEEDENIQKSSLISLCNICHDVNVQESISSANPIPVLVLRLQSSSERICTLAAHIICNITEIGNNKTLFGLENAIQALITVLASEKEEMLLEATDAVYKLCFNHLDNLHIATDSEVIVSLVQLLLRANMTDQALLSICEACALLIENNPRGQLLMVQANGIEALSKLLHSQNVHLQIRAAKILGVLASSHRKMINEDVMKPMIAMLKVWDIEVRIQGASALWALAGSTMALQKFTATSIGVKLLINMLLTKNDKLIYYACRFIAAFALEDIDNQNIFLKEGGVESLVRYVLSCEEHESVMFEIIRTLGILCVGVAHSNNLAVQKQIARHDSMRCMTKHANGENYSEELRVEVLYTLACVVLNSEENLKLLSHHGGFNYNAVIQLMHSEKEQVRIKAGLALSTYAFNKRQFQNELHKAGRIDIQFFEHFLQSNNELNKCLAAFQMAILAHLVAQGDPILITARGLTYLTSKLSDTNEDTFTISASLVSSLARSRTGIPDALVTLQVVESLVSRLRSDNSQVRTTCAIALGYLSFNFKANRRLLLCCRADPDLFELLMCNLQQNSKLSDNFVEAIITSQICKKAKIIRIINSCPQIANIIQSRHYKQ